LLYIAKRLVSKASNYCPSIVMKVGGQINDFFPFYIHKKFFVFGLKSQGKAIFGSFFVPFSAIFDQNHKVYRLWTNFLDRIE
jgi:hypothetical protein